MVFVVSIPWKWKQKNQAIHGHLRPVLAAGDHSPFKLGVAQLVEPLPGMQKVLGLIPSSIYTHIHQLQWCTPVLSTLGKWNQEGDNLKAILCSLESLRPAKEEGKSLASRGGSSSLFSALFWVVAISILFLTCWISMRGKKNPTK